MKCPKQIAFAAHLNELLKLAKDLGMDHFSVDEWDRKFDELNRLKGIFINNWCPTLKEYEGFDEPLS